LAWKKPPSYTTIRAIIIGLPSHVLEEIFREHANILSDIPDDEIAHYAIDGKVIRGSFDHFKGQTAIQFLSLFCSNNNLIMAHEEVECKTNEIPVAQELIPKLGIKNAVFTSDAINCQFKTIDIVKASGNDIIVQVKSNQKKLLEYCENSAKSNMLISEHKEPISKGRNRIETRVAKVYSPDILQQIGKWSKVSCIIEIERKRLVLNTKNNEWKNEGEISYYIATNTLSAEKVNAIIRNHWGVENKNHYVKDATMNEDKSRIRVNPQNMAIFRSFALNIMRFNNVKNIKQELYRNALNFAKLQNYKGL